MNPSVSFVHYLTNLSKTPEKADPDLRNAAPDIIDR